MTRPSHPKKEIETAIRYAESQGWQVTVGGAHAWGKLLCPYNDEECRCGIFCRVGIWSTPKSADNHAKDIKRVVDNCTTHRDKKTGTPVGGEDNGIRVHTQVSTGRTR